MDHQSLYQSKLTTPEKAAELVSDGKALVKGMGVSEPPALLKAIGARVAAKDLKQIKFYYFHSEKYAQEYLLRYEYLDIVKPYCFFLTSVERELVKQGEAEGRKVIFYVPNSFSQAPRFFRDYVDVDTFIVTVSPMDEHGYFSFGTNNDYATSVARQCKKLIVEVNNYMPRVFGQSQLHISEVHKIVENHVPLLEIKPTLPQPEDEIIGEQISKLIIDGATLQMGVGSLPDSICRYLMNHQNLGIHSEALGAGMIELIKKGVVNGSKKNLNRYKSVFTFTIGDKNLYDFIHDNMGVESYPVDYTNDPRIIAQHDNFVSINTILQIDLTGQCNAEHLLGHQYSGSGGQLDFVRGAFLSRGGKSIIAFHSTTKNQTISRIVPSLTAPVTDSRTDTHIVVSEYGHMDLKGKSVTERALGLIELAHPKFRAELTAEAKKLHLI